MGHARALLALSEPRAQLAACRQVVEKGLSVRETEELLRRVPAKPAQKKRIPPDPGLLELETRIRRALSTKVRIRPGRKGGKIEIEYYSAEELERLAVLLQGEGDTALTGSK